MTQPDVRSSLAGMSIGAVLDLLRGDFPDVTISKIRFLEAEGLVTPERTASGYRRFTAYDCARLRFILTAQRDQYLPLKVIKDYLDAIDRGERPDNLPPGVTVSPRIVSEELASELQNRVRRLSEEQLRAESGASVPLVESLLSFGLIGHVNGKFDENALQVARACVQLENHGLEPRHLRPFQAAAEREFGLVERAVATLTSRKDAASHARAAETAREISELCLTLHRALVQDRISRMDN